MNKLLIFCLLLCTVLSGNIWPWGDLIFEDNQRDGQISTIHLFFQLETGAMSNSYLKVNFPFTILSNQDYKYGIYEQESRLSEPKLTIIEYSKGQAKFNSAEDKTTLFVRIPQNLEPLVKYKLNMTVPHTIIQNSDITGFVGVYTMTGALSDNYIIIDSNPTFGYISFQDPIPSLKNVDIFADLLVQSTNGAKYIATVSIEFNNQINSVFKIYLVMETGSIQYTNDVTCTVASITDTLVINSSTICQKQSSNILVATIYNQVPENGVIFINIDSIQNSDTYNEMQYLQVSVVLQNSTTPAYRASLNDAFQTQPIQLDFDVSYRFAWGIKNDTFVNLYSQTNDQIYQNLIFVITPIADTNNNLQYQIQIDLGKSLTILKSSLHHNLTKISDTQQPYCYITLDSSDMANQKHIITCINIGPLTTSQNYVIGFRINTYLLYEDISSTIYMYSSLSSTGPIEQSTEVKQSLNIPITQVSMNSANQSYFGGNTTLYSIVNTSKPNVSPPQYSGPSSSIDIGIIVNLKVSDLDQPTISSGLGVQLIFNKYIQFSSQTSTTATNYGLVQTNSTTISNIIDYSKLYVQNDIAQDYNIFQGLFDTTGTPLSALETQMWLTVKSIKITELSPGRADEATFDIYCGFIKQFGDETAHANFVQINPIMYATMLFGVVSQTLAFSSSNQLVYDKFGVSLLYGSNSDNLGFENLPSLLRIIGSEVEFENSGAIVLFFQNIVPVQIEGKNKNIVNCFGNSGTASNSDLSCKFYEGEATNLFSSDYMVDAAKAHRLEITWTSVFKSKATFQILIPVNITDVYNSFDIVTALGIVKNPLKISLRQGESAKSSLSGNVLKNVTYPVNTNSQGNTQVGIRCKSDCQLNTSYTSSSIKFNLQPLQDITHNDYSTGDIGSGLFWCTNWYANTKFTSNDMLDSTSFTEDKCLEVNYSTVLGNPINRYCIFCPISKNEPVNSSLKTLTFDKITFSPSYALSTNNVFGCLSTNTGNIVGCDSYFEIISGNISNVSIISNNTYKQNETRNFIIGMKLQNPFGVKSITIQWSGWSQNFSFVDPDSSVLYIEELQQEIIIKWTIAKDKVTASWSNPLTIATPLNIILKQKKGFKVYELASLRGNYSILRITTSTDQINLPSNTIFLRVTEQNSVISPLIFNPQFDFPFRGARTQFSVKFQSEPGRQIFTGEIFIITWTSSIWWTDKNINSEIQCQVILDSNKSISWEWESCEVSLSGISIKAARDIQPNINYTVILSYFYALDPKNKTLTCNIITSTGVTLTAYSPKIPVVPFYNSSSLLISRTIILTRDISTSGQFSNLQFIITHTKTIQTNYTILIEFPEYYSSKLSSLTFVNCFLGEQQTWCEFEYDRRLILTNFAQSISAGTQFKINVTGVQIPANQYTGQFFIAIYKTNKTDMIGYQIINDLSVPSRVSSILLVNNIFLDITSTRTFGNLFINLTASQNTTDQLQFMQIEFPSNWEKQILLSPQLTCTASKYINSSWVTISNYSTTQDHYKVIMSLNDTINTYTQVQTICQYLYGPDFPLNQIEQMPIISITDKTGLTTTMKSVQNRFQFPYKVNITQNTSLINLILSENKIYIQKGVISNKIIRFTPDYSNFMNKSRPAYFLTSIYLYLIQTGIQLIPNQLSAEIKDTYIEFQIGTTNDVLLGKHYLKLRKIEASPPLYLNLPVIEIIVEQEQTVVQIPTETILIVKGKQSLPINLYIENQPYEQLEVLIIAVRTDYKVASDRKLLTFVKQSNEIFYLVDSGSDIGTEGEFIFLLQGISASSYKLPENNKIKFKIIGSYNDAPVIVETKLNVTHQYNTPNSVVINVVTKSQQNLNPAPGIVVYWYLHTTPIDIEKDFYTVRQNILDLSLVQQQSLDNTSVLAYSEVDQQYAVERFGFFLVAGNSTQTLTQLYMQDLEANIGYKITFWAVNAENITANSTSQTEFTTDNNKGVIQRIDFQFDDETFSFGELNNLLCILPEYIQISKQQIRSVFDSICSVQGQLKDKLHLDISQTDQVTNKQIIVYPIYVIPNYAILNDQSVESIQTFLTKKTDFLSYSLIKLLVPSLIGYNSTVRQLSKQYPYLYDDLNINISSNFIRISNFKVVDITTKKTNITGYYIYALLTTNAQQSPSPLDFRSVSNRTYDKFVLLRDSITNSITQVSFSGLIPNINYYLYISVTNEDPTLNSEWGNIITKTIKIKLSESLANHIQYTTFMILFTLIYIYIS